MKRLSYFYRIGVGPGLFSPQCSIDYRIARPRNSP
jgi:hypothetical protein